MHDHRDYRRDDRGQSTAEYAVGTVGAAGLGFALIHLVGTGWFGDLIQSIIALVHLYAIPFRTL
ncbi:MAG: DUF4244 domain-containing protein [Actinomycetia bacterium]|nr:DUF4244 domain-containing protein [Actinomycetes bacterium]